MVRSSGVLGRRGWSASCAAVAAVGSLAVAGQLVPAVAVAAPAAAVPVKVTSAGATSEAADALTAVLAAKLQGSRVEDLSSRTESSKRFANPEGTWTVEDFGLPVQVQDGDGTWQEIDLTLETGSDGTISPRVSATPVEIGGGAPGELGRTEVAEDALLAVTWPGGDLGEPVLEGPTAVYKVDETSDLLVTATRTGMNVRLRLNEAPTEPVDEVVLGLEARGGTLVEREGGVALLDEAGEVLGQTAELVAWDDAGEAGGAGTEASEVVELSPELSKATTRTERVAGAKRAVRSHKLRLGVPEGFLTDPATVYPVVIDPDISSMTGRGDTWMRSGTGSKSTDSQLVVGNTSATAAEARTYIGWEIGDTTRLPAGAEILSATMQLFQFEANSCIARRTNVHPLGTAFSVSDTWSNRPTAKTDTGTSTYFTDNRGGGTCTSSNGFVNVPLTAMVKYWQANPAKNFGLVLNVPTENIGNELFSKRYCSWNEDPSASACNLHSRGPKLAITYTKTPPAPGIPTFVSTGTAGWTSNQRPTLTTSGKDAYTDAVKYEMQILSGTTVAASCTTGQVASGAAASCTPTTSLPATGGTTYTVRARTINAHGKASGWSGTRALGLDTVAPPAPTISATGLSNGGWNDAALTSSTFTYTGGTANNVVRYIVRRDGGAETSLASTSSGPVTHAWSPLAVGGHTVTVTSVDRVGKVSAPATFTFGTGKPSITVPGAAGVKATSSVRVEAMAPAPAPGTTVTAYIRWRNIDAGSQTWGTPAVLPSTVSGTTVRVAQNVDAHAVAVWMGRERLHTTLEMQVYFTYSQAGAGTKYTDARRLFYVPHAFGNGFPVAEAGPGQVALWTGEMLTSATDVSVPGFGSELTVSRTYASFDNAASLPSPFGPGWTASFDGAAGGAATYDVEDSTAFDGTFALVDEEFNALLFAHPAGKQAGAPRTGRYVPLDVDTAGTETTLDVSVSGTTYRLVLTEADGTRTTWVRTAVETWVVESVQEPGNASATTFGRDGAGRITRIVAPVPARSGSAITCAAGAEQPGCRVLTITYATTTTGTQVAGQVSQVSYTAFDPQTSAMRTTVVATYAYDSAKRLVKVTDPRAGLSTSYAYGGLTKAGVPQLASLTPAGLAPYTFTYANLTSGGMALTDALTKVDRAAGTGVAAARLASFGYFVPLSTGADVSATSVARWEQPGAPTAAFVVLGQDAPASLNAQALSGTNGRYGSYQYTDASGYVLNTADWGGSSWNLTATRYDSGGRVIHELDERGIAAILAERAAGRTPLVDSFATLTRFNAEIKAATAITPAVGAVVPAGTVLVPAGARVTDTWAPAVEYTGPDGTVQLGRLHTRTTFDAGAPNSGINHKTGLAWNLATEQVTYLVPASAGTTDPAGTVDVTGAVEISRTRTGYDPIDGASVTGETSGWVLGAATSQTTVDPDAPDLVTRTRFDALGRTLEVREPTSDGTDDRTTRTLYYTADAQSAGDFTDARCGAKPAWAGMECLTRSAAGTAKKAETLTEYSHYMASAKTVEKAGGATRTTTTTFDNAGRETQVATTASGLTGSTARPATRYTYHPATGLKTETATVDGASVIAKVSETFDGWGRQIAYADSVTGSASASTTYDAAGRVASFTDTLGRATTNTYEPYTGRLVGQTVAGVGSFSATYSNVGDLLTQKMPGGLVQTSTYDRTGQETALFYAINGVEAYSWTLDRDSQGRISKMNGPSPDGNGRVQSYRYDRPGRLTQVKDTAAGVCTSRNYTFDAAGHRTNLSTNVGDGKCAGGSDVVRSWSYDKADRVQNAGTGQGSYVYDALGRQTLVPAVDAPGGSDIEIAYFDDDLARSITTGGTSTTFDLDALARRSVTTTTGGAASVVTRVYSDTSDNPTGAREMSDGVTRTSSYAGAIAGDMLYTQVDSEEATLTSVGIADPIGSVVATLTLSDVGGVRTALPGDGSGLAVYDEYGNRAGAGVKAGALDYGWLGGKERASDPSGLLLMGVRLFNSVTGLFTSVDPVVGGNESVYGYPNDPINKLDLDGNAWNWKAIAITSAVVLVGAAACISFPASCGAVAVGVARVAVAVGSKVAARAAPATRISNVARRGQSLRRFQPVSAKVANRAGAKFVGSGAKSGKVGTVSRDGLRRYRPPMVKESGRKVANFETRSKPSGRWNYPNRTYNGHLDVR
ncbi:DNRLRE domain-containing protein [Sanguibacter sp. A247]|uniref:DNRLRE domain-containing protein n=1 Tax=unclassified Sanguibacter TaxID=2645534 RepID=UPI003FD75C4D